MSVESTMWLGLVAFMIHDFEEIIFIPRWSRSMSIRAGGRIPRSFEKVLSSTAAQGAEGFAFQVWILFAMVSVIILACVEFHLYTLFIAFALIGAVHGIGHCLQALFLRMYVPAVGTAIPASAYWVFAAHALAVRGLIHWEALPLNCLALGGIMLPAFIGIKILANRIFSGSPASVPNATSSS